MIQFGLSIIYPLNVIHATGPSSYLCTKETRFLSSLNKHAETPDSMCIKYGWPHQLSVVKVRDALLPPRYTAVIDPRAAAVEFISRSQP